jgi:23S rRNA (cytosine1962-C5)-methyltransferase
MTTEPHILITEPSADYALLDSGTGEKLERFGEFVLSRPDPQALWPKLLPEADWKKAHGRFTRDGKQGDWSLKPGTPDKWPVTLGGLKFWIKPTPFKHVGLFPEQLPNWTWLSGIISNSKSSSAEVLNLFGYTGAATLACAQAGASVVHVDGSKAAIAWARENAELSGLGTKPVRWILDDARAFVRREVKRGRLYDGIIMDPPAFGHGPDNEIWNIEEHFLPLLADCLALLKPQPLFFLINGYAAGYSAIAYENNLLPLKDKYGGNVEKGELALQENHASKRLLPCGIFARWKA